jgi:hypothetical protein
MYLIFNVIAASFSLAIIKDRDIFFSYPIRIEALSVAFSAFIFSLARAVDRFSAVYSVFARSLL